jgi:hypothetical protein
MSDKPGNFGRPAANAIDSPAVPILAHRATVQTELDERRFQEKTQARERDVIAPMVAGTPTVLLRGRTKVSANGALSIGSTTAPTSSPSRPTLEDRTSTFDKAGRSTLTARDAPGELDRAPHPLDELANTLACSSSPQWDAARCRHIAGSTTALFFSDDIGDINRAKGICSGCPMAVPCLQGALDRREPCGVWGGYLFENGQILARKRPRGRPPKSQPAPSITQTCSYGGRGSASLTRTAITS